ncbi:MAG: hypothetical protein RSF90_02285 [Pygmaiobacter sp.]
MLEQEKKDALPATANKKKSLSDIQVPNWLAIVLILAAVVIIAVVFLLRGIRFAAQTGTVLADEPSSEATQVEVLPQRVRQFTDGESGNNPFASDNLGAVQLTGIITNSAGKATVILQTEQASYIASEGETLPDSEWVVSEVGTNYVTFSLEDNEKTIWLNGAKASEGEQK